MKTFDYNACKKEKGCTILYRKGDGNNTVTEIVRGRLKPDSQDESTGIKVDNKLYKSIKSLNVSLGSTCIYTEINGKPYEDFYSFVNYGLNPVIGPLMIDNFLDLLANYITMHNSTAMRRYYHYMPATIKDIDNLEVCGLKEYLREFNRNAYRIFDSKDSNAIWHIFYRLYSLISYFDIRFIRLLSLTADYYYLIDSLNITYDMDKYFDLDCDKHFRRDMIDLLDGYYDFSVREAISTHFKYKAVVKNEEKYALSTLNRLREVYPECEYTNWVHTLYLSEKEKYDSLYCNKGYFDDLLRDIMYDIGFVNPLKNWHYVGGYVMRNRLRESFDLTDNLQYQGIATVIDFRVLLPGHEDVVGTHTLEDSKDKYVYDNCKYKFSVFSDYYTTLVGMTYDLSILMNSRYKNKLYVFNYDSLEEENSIIKYWETFQEKILSFIYKFKSIKQVKERSIPDISKMYKAYNLVKVPEIVTAHGLDYYRAVTSTSTREISSEGNFIRNYIDEYGKSHIDLMLDCRDWDRMKKEDKNCPSYAELAESIEARYGYTPLITSDYVFNEYYRYQDMDITTVNPYSYPFFFEPEDLDTKYVNLMYDSEPENDSDSTQSKKTTSTPSKKSKPKSSKKSDSIPDVEFGFMSLEEMKSEFYKGLDSLASDEDDLPF